eukprot:3053512-Prymnesium_polylepis.1
MQSREARLQRGEVFLHVYDLSNEPKIRNINRVSAMLGGGLYHTAIQVAGLSDGLEWSFGAITDASGVYSCGARDNPQHAYREPISLGRTTLTRAAFETLIGQMSATWHGSTYHLTSRNCQSFCEELAARLGVSPLPEWIRRFAKIGEVLLRKSGKQPAAAPGALGAAGGSMPPRTQAAVDGIVMLKRKGGVQAVKLDRFGVPRLATFRLSEDETRLQWDGRLTTKSIDLTDIVELLVGHDSAVFQRTNLRAVHAEHLSLTLLLTASLPAPPSADDVEAPCSQRQYARPPLHLKNTTPFPSPRHPHQPSNGTPRPHARPPLAASRHPQTLAPGSPSHSARMRERFAWRAPEA